MTSAANAPVVADRNARPPWLDQRLYPFASRYAQIDGQRLHYVDEGTGPVIFFLSGLPAWSFMYRNLIRGLREHFRCIALDLPGQGLSTAPANDVLTLPGLSDLIERVIVSLRIDPIILVAHGYGGPVGLGVVARHPGWFRGLLLANTFAWPLTDVPRAGPMIRALASPVGRALIVNARALSRLFPRLATRRQLPPDELRAYLTPLTVRSTRETCHALFRAVRDDSGYLEALGPALEAAQDVPTMLVWGTEDVGYQMGFVERFERIFPCVERVIVSGGRHYAPEDGAVEIVARILERWPNPRQIDVVAPNASLTTEQPPARIRAIG